ncbi:MAG: hypothetical protein CMH28_08075 [Micavibrio sp.]|nr:hypothetical protein [Micavibrio sp.]
MITDKGRNIMNNRKEHKAKTNASHTSHAEGAVNIEKSLTVIEKLTDQLQSIIERETKSLEDHDIEKFVQYQMEKARLAKNYEIEAQKLLSVREKLREADEDLRKRVKKAQESFLESSEQNAAILMRRQISAQRLNERIMGAARQALSGEDIAYTAAGKKTNSVRKTLSSGAGSTI